MAETPEVARPGPVANRERRQEILDAAGRSFRRRGFARTTMNTIGKDVGVAAAALYWYFPSKEVILSEYLEGMLRAFVDAVESTLAQLPEDTPIGEKLRTALETHIRYHQSGRSSRIASTPRRNPASRCQVHCDSVSSSSSASSWISTVAWCQKAYASVSSIASRSRRQPSRSSPSPNTPRPGTTPRVNSASMSLHGSMAILPSAWCHEGVERTLYRARPEAVSLMSTDARVVPLGPSPWVLVEDMNDLT